MVLLKSALFWCASLSVCSFSVKNHRISRNSSGIASVADERPIRKMEVTESSPVCPTKEEHDDQKTKDAATTDKDAATDNCDICVATSPSTTTMEEVDTNKFTAATQEMKAVANNPGAVKAFELAESVESQEETEDESDDGEMRQFLNLMNKAERKNQKRVQVQAVGN